MKMADPCLHSEDWGKLKSKTEQMEHDLYGNGKQGLRADVTDLKHQTNNVITTLEKVSEDVSAIKTTISAVVRSQEDMDKWRMDHEFLALEEKQQAAELVAKAKEDADDKFTKRASKQNRVMGAVMLVIALINLATFLSLNLQK